MIAEKRKVFFSFFFYSAFSSGLLPQEACK